MDWSKNKTKNSKSKKARDKASRTQKAIRERQLNEMLELFDQYGPRKQTRKHAGRQWEKGSL
jgi:hypothetical protein